MSLLSYEERMRRAFNLSKISESYVDAGHMDERGFDEVLEQTVAIRALGIEGLDWLLFDQLISARRDVPLAAHYQALAHGMNRPFSGIHRFYEQLIDLELMPPSVLNRTIFFRPPTGQLRIGELMISLGLLDQTTLHRCIGVKETIKYRAGVSVAVGQVFRSIAGLSIIDFFQALAIQVGVPFEDLDRSAPEIYRLAGDRNALRKKDEG